MISVIIPTLIEKKNIKTISKKFLSHYKLLIIFSVIFFASANNINVLSL